MSRKQAIIKGTFILTITGLITRFMGFFYRIFLSHTIGEEGVGIYQLIFPVYALCFSLTSAGIELALSRSISKYCTLGNKKRVQDLLFTSLVLTLFFSLLITLLLQHFSYVIAEKFLHNTETTELLLLLSYIFPFAAIHSCIVGYYLGLKRPKIPAISQFFEQTFRISSVIIFYKLSKLMFFKFQIIFSVFGLLIGEIAASIYCVKILTGKYFPTKYPHMSLCTFLSCTKELILLSFPITLNRVFINLLQSIEAISIPLSLRKYGLNYEEALSTYGVLTGMALPCILFPSAVTNAFSTILLPTVSELNTLNDYRLLKKLIKKSIIYCTLLGAFCCISFLLFGNMAGLIIFKSKLAGKFIITLAWICPFLYTNNTLISIINGTGKTFVTLCINIFNLSIRIISAVFVVPLYGIHGYLIGLLLSQIFVFLSCFIYMNTIVKAEE